MKKYSVYSLLLAAIIGVSGCGEYLNILPESELTIAGSYKTDVDFQMAIAGTYGRLNTLHQSAIITSSLRSDDAMIMPNVQHAQFDNLDKFRETESNPAILTLWRGYWQIISQSNTILDQINKVEFRDANLKNHITGEAYLLRAYSYWNLAYQFGGVPLIDRRLSVPDMLKIPRSSIDESLAFAVEDYKKAISLLPTEWDSQFRGRATKYAAEGLLARLYLFKSEFSLAKPLLNSIIFSEKYAMETEYADCFTDSKDNGPERVFEAQYIGGQTGLGQGFSSLWYGEAFTDRTIAPVPGSNPYPVVTDNLYGAYEVNDNRRDLSVLVGWGNTPGKEDDLTTMFCVKYLHHDYTPVVRSDWANNLPILRYTDVKLMYAEVLNEESYVADGEAFSILNEVRARAGLPVLTGNDLTDQSTFRDAIIQERRVEFAFEGLRWGDLVRWGIAQDVMNNFFSTTTYDSGASRYTMGAHQTLFPIPGTEILNYNDQQIMWQNPGY